MIILNLELLKFDGVHGFFGIQVLVVLGRTEHIGTKTESNQKTEPNQNDHIWLFRFYIITVFGFGSMRFDSIQNRENHTNINRTDTKSNRTDHIRFGFGSMLSPSSWRQVKFSFVMDLRKMITWSTRYIKVVDLRWKDRSFRVFWRLIDHLLQDNGFCKRLVRLVGKVG